MRQTFLALFLSILAFSLSAQQVPMESLSLDNLSAFQEQAGNWMVVGSVTVDPNTDIHQKKPASEKTKKKKKRKSKKSEDSVSQSGPVRYEAGAGILLNMNDETTKDNLLTSWEHGDILLELEVMMPKGSNSGIYLQGRYEIQLLDSWGVKNPRYGDIGGIYRNWETEPGKIYMGKAPLTNAAKAPGLWQTMEIAFQAPKFDESGNKTANARFVYLDLNGERIHENVEVPLPTGGPVENNEVARGPIMIQGDHGPVAFRNIKYCLMEESDVQLSNISFKVYENASTNVDSLTNAQAVQEGTINQLTTDLPDVDDDFTVIYEGNITTSEAGTYQLKMNYMGRALLEVDGEAKTELGNFDGYRVQNDLTIELSAGKTPFRLVYLKETPQWDTRIGLFSTDSYSRPLHNPNSYQPDIPETGPIYVKVADEPRMLRAFLDYEGNPSQRLTHTIGVGEPSGAHFAYNLTTGTPVCVWRGEFINATPMWYNRGDGSFRPRGAVQYLFPSTSFANLSDANAPFPIQINEAGDWQSNGYRIDSKTNLPVFLYQNNRKTLEDHIRADENGKMLTRTLTLTEGEPTGKTYVKLAEGTEIQSMPDGSYAVDQQYYIRPASSESVRVRTVNQKQELVAPLQRSSFAYSIIW
ncbi:MAG: family 16 glycoside hydrolase [Bacteroidota bacterium]